MNNDFGIGKRYRVKEGFFSKEDFSRTIFQFLKDHPFVSYEVIAINIGSRPNEVKEILDEGIIKYCRTYKEERKTNIGTSTLCSKLGVKTEYVIDLIEAGSLIVDPTTLSSALDLEKSYEAINRKKEMQDTLMGLSNAFGYNGSREKNLSSQPMGYHTDYTRRRK